MKRRAFILSSLSFVAAGKASAADKPWSARLLRGGFDGKQWWTGLHITLAPKWKTYWRVPGKGGIAPELALTGNNMAKHEVFDPLPQRYEDEAGTTIGYKHEVVFPIAVEPADAAKPVEVSLKAFIGVCDVVCIPAQFSSGMTFAAAASAAPDQQLISRWLRFVPRVATGEPVTKASAQLEDGKVWLQLETLEGARDIFVEGKPGHYFGKPTLMRGLAVFHVHGANTVEELKGSQLRITLDANSGPVEQSLVVD